MARWIRLTMKPREALEHHRLHAQCGQAGGELRDELSGIGRMADDFDEGYDVRGHKVVRHDQLGMQDGRSVFEDVEDGGVAGYQGRRGHDAGQFLVKTALDVHPFRNDFDDELGTSRRSESVLRKPQPGHDAFRRFSSQLLGLRARKSADGPFRPIQSVPVDVGEGDGMSAAREPQRNGMAHRTGSENDHVPKKHTASPCSRFPKGTEQPLPAPVDSLMSKACAMPYRENNVIGERGMRSFVSGGRPPFCSNNGRYPYIEHSIHMQDGQNRMLYCFSLR